MTEEQIENYRNEGWIPRSESNENEDFINMMMINGEVWVLPRNPKGSKPYRTIYQRC